MTALEYKNQFDELVKHATTILLIEYEQIWCFVQGLRLSLCKATQSLVATGRSFNKISDYSQTMEKMYHEV